jgi:hypothetical protein
MMDRVLTEHNTTSALQGGRREEGGGRREEGGGRREEGGGRRENSPLHVFHTPLTQISRMP